MSERIADGQLGEDSCDHHTLFVIAANWEHNKNAILFRQIKRTNGMDNWSPDTIMGSLKDLYDAGLVTRRKFSVPNSDGTENPRNAYAPSSAGIEVLHECGIPKYFMSTADHIPEDHTESLIEHRHSPPDTQPLTPEDFGREQWDPKSEDEQEDNPLPREATKSREVLEKIYHRGPMTSQSVEETLGYDDSTGVMSHLKSKGFVQIEPGHGENLYGLTDTTRDRLSRVLDDAPEYVGPDPEEMHEIATLLRNIHSLVDDNEGGPYQNLINRIELLQEMVDDHLHARHDILQDELGIRVPSDNPEMEYEKADKNKLDQILEEVQSDSGDFTLHLTKDQMRELIREAPDDIADMALESL